MFGEIGSVRNKADEVSLQILALFRESISEIHRVILIHILSSIISSLNIPIISWYIRPWISGSLRKGKSGICAFAGMSEYQLWNVL